MTPAIPPILACDLTAIAAEERPRYAELVTRIREAIRERTEYSDGYAFQLGTGNLSLPEVAEWMAMERLCCPFLTLQLSTGGTEEHWLLTLTGPEGIKPLLDAEFPAV